MNPSTHPSSTSSPLNLPSARSSFGDRVRAGLLNPPSERAFWLTSWGVFVFAWAIFVIYIQFPSTPNFDEFHYLPSARQFLGLIENQNYEHPPLGKELIALGIGLFGDHPFGWRIMSTLFGACTALGMYVAGLALFRTQLSGLFVAGVALFNHLLYVQSRIAMLDTFMTAFLIWAFALGLLVFFPLYSHSNRLRHLQLSGIALGLAIATKWFAIIPWAALVGVVLLFKLLQALNVRFGNAAEPTDLPTFYPLPETGISSSQFILAWGILPVLAYYLTFLPFFWVTTKAGGHYSLSDILFQMQWRMWDGQMRVGTTHPYASKWYQWPLMNRPIWYSFASGTRPQTIRGIILLGNPLVMWGGLVALAWTAWDWIRSRSFAAFWIAFTYLALLLSWVVIPRKVAFYYYYYPLAFLLSFAWGYLLRKTPAWMHALVLLAIFTLFVYFLPLLSGFPIPRDSYRSWMWFRSWI